MRNYAVFCVFSLQLYTLFILQIFKTTFSLVYMYIFYRYILLYLLLYKTAHGKFLKMLLDIHKFWHLKCETHTWRIFRKLIIKYTRFSRARFTFL